MEVKAVGSSSFEAEVMQASQPVIVEFWTEDCKPCEKLGNVVASTPAGLNCSMQCR
jgi:thioredoxin-like negative regulator of GroEL